MRMKITIVLVFVLMSIMGFSQNYDLPTNPEPGKCYVKCYKEEKRITKWEVIDCALVSFQSLDVKFENTNNELSWNDIKVINKKLVPFIKTGYRLNMLSHYVSNASDSINIKISSERAIAIGNYLVERGMNPKLIAVKSYGNSRSDKTMLEYRIINACVE